MIELEQWIAVAVVVALPGLIAIALTAMLAKMVIDAIRRRQWVREWRRRGRRAWDNTAWMDEEEDAK